MQAIRTLFRNSPFFNYIYPSPFFQLHWKQLDVADLVDPPLTKRAVKAGLIEVPVGLVATTHVTGPR
ncbi:hypothetical protein [Mycobacterium marinum]|uniref:hypothetical protein n=1 Tax=Mycobacterium marinum TaxID=1781 RepID=UPI0021C38B97|nr:hypothetical protein [Mycobacterium marinum]